MLLDDQEYLFIYGPGLTPIAQIDGSESEYLYSDNIGTVRTVASDDATTTATTGYDPYGRRTAHIGMLDSSIGYTGAWTDPLTTLVYLRARDLDPRSGQFLSADPLVSATRAPYAYARNNPLIVTDPLGLIPGGCPPGHVCPAPPSWEDIFSNPANAQMFQAAQAGFNDGATFGLSALGRPDCVQQAYEAQDVYHLEKVIGLIVMGAATYGVGTEIGLLVKAGTGIADTFSGLNAAVKAGQAGSQAPRVAAAVVEAGPTSTDIFALVPEGRTLNSWGYEIWGTGAAGAREMLGTRSASELQELGLTVGVATKLRDFYAAAAAAGRGGSAAPVRVDLMNDIIQVLGGKP